MNSLSALELDELIEKIYLYRFGLVGLVATGYLQVEVTELLDDQKELVRNYARGLPIPEGEVRNVIEALLADLCSQGKLKKGLYIIENTD
jgi:hypothetical protein